MKYLRVLSLLVVVTIITWVTVSALNRRAAQEIKPAKDVVILSTETYYPQDGEPIHRSIRERRIRANGEWKEIRTEDRKGDLTVITSVSTKKGQYTDIRGKNQYMGEWVEFDLHTRTEAYWLANKELVREDSLLGYKAFVLRSNQGPGSLVEQWVAPELAPFGIKWVIIGSNGHTVIEPMSVQFRKITDDDLKMSDNPTTAESLSDMIKKGEQSGWNVDGLKKKLSAFEAKQQEKKQP
jgi:hypothetical protein